jgi:ADP-heptose:LPS heptosyltransferase
LTDFSKTAALIGELDFIITVDTAAAHIAGALGKPIWILLRFDACWRWLVDRCDSPWYPTARLYRQDKLGDWRGAIERVKRDLFPSTSGADVPGK